MKLKVTYRAFDREFTEYLSNSLTIEEVKAYLYDKCYTYHIVRIEYNVKETD